MAVTPVEEIAEAVAFVGVLSVGWVALGRDVVRRWRSEQRARIRSRRVEAAAIDAALEVEAFGPDRIRASVGALLELAGGRRPQERRRTSQTRDDVMVQRWRADHGIQPTMKLCNTPTVDLLRVVNRRGESEDRAIVRVRATFRDDDDPTRTEIRVDDRWTLAREDDRWRLVEFDHTPLSDELLSSPVIPGEWADVGRLTEQAFTELARDEPDSRRADLIDADRDPTHQLLDLAVADARWGPGLVETTLCQLVEAWEEATWGSTDQLIQRTSAEAREELLHPTANGERMRFILRDARLRSWRPAAITTDHQPATLEVLVMVSAIRYLVDPITGRHRHGSDEHPHAIELRWTLKRSAANKRPWRLDHSSTPTRDIPGVDPD